MISVESRDGRKGLEQRFGSNKRETDDIELEEGEACSYQEEDDTSIDPDVALSYLDEKLQNVLGHFKKDFEGVVSIENLGAKYGTYGSFLPVYRRSPVSGHSRSPTRVQNLNTSQSLSTLRVEGGRHNSLVQANVPHSIKHGSASSYAYKPPSQNDQCKQTASTQSMQSTEECIPKSEVRDQRTLKVRIKVGTDNLLVKKNAEIYSGLGLDNSPSSSFNDSPVYCEGLSRRLPNESHESPTQILQMMASSLLFGGCLLSPLPDHLVQFSERPELLQDVLTQPSSKASQVNSVIGHPCYSPEEDNKKSSVENSMKLLDKKGSSLQVKKDGENNHIGFDFTVKETDIDAVCCELVSSALKLPLLSNAYDTMGVSTRASPNQKIYSKAAEPLEPASLSGKADEKGNSAGNVTDRTANSSTTTDKVGAKSKKGSKSGQKDSVKQKAERSTGSDGGTGLPCRKEQLSSGDKKKLKKSQVHGLERSLKQKILSKARDKYKDFFGDMNDQELDVMDSSKVVENAALACESTSRDKISSFETHKEVISGTRLRESSHNGSAENGRPISDPAPGWVEADDKWVCCDKCQKWRLLPPGSKVDSLPEKWVCSMMTWLPDMKHCSISEEETTAAFRARYQFLLTENASSLHVPLDSLATGMCSADMLDRIVPNDGEMIDKLRKTSKSSFQNSPNRMPNSMKKKQQSAKARTSMENKESPLVNGLGFQQLTKSNGTYVETNQDKRNHKRRADHDCDGGHTKMSKIKSKKEPDEEPPRTSKKTKTPSIQSGDNGVGSNTVGKDKMGISELFPSRNSKHDMDGDLLDTFVKSKYQVEAFPDVTSLHVSKSGNNIAHKKRKTDIFQDPSSSTPLGKLTPDNEKLSRKKHRISRSEGKESSASKRNDKTGKSILQPSLDDTESLRKDSSGTRPIVAATSSSTKVSGSLKVKSKLHELKGSPVESVSSSPLRISNADKITSGSKITVEKDNTQDKNNKSDSEKGLVEMSESYDNLLDHAPLYEEKGRDNKIKVQEKLGSNADKAEKDVICNNEELSIPKSKIQKDYDEKITFKKVDMVNRPDHLSTSTRDKSRHLGNGVTTSSSSAHASDLQKEPQPDKKADSQNGTHNIPSKYPTTNGHRGKNSDAPSPFRRDASSQAASHAHKEAKILKHIADRQREEGSAESTGMYFEAALKFLHAASLLESGKTENAKHVQSMQMYSSTAKLCRYCAHEYEKSKDMATAALAYKCMEVAYLRVIYSSHHSASRDRHDLQTALQMVPPGESPSSSASDIDNLNNSVAADKAPPARSAGSPQLAANLVIAARNRPNFSRLLSFAQDVNSAMEASRKSRVTFAAANVSMDQGDFKDVIASIKTALDFNFHDVEGLLRLVRLAKEATSR